MAHEHMIAPGTVVNLADHDPEFDGGLSKKDGKRALAKLLEKLPKLQELMYAEDKHTLLLVFQATDTGGKDGTIRAVMGGVNPQGCHVTSFKVPTDEELAHDFLWRINRALPARRMIGIFNRSHYEDVLVVRVHNLVPPEVWEPRYEQINHFERRLTDSGTTILKFFLHISKDEQKARLQERLDDPEKWWKFSLGDLKERERWDEYAEAYEAMLTRTSTDWAPWYVIPANRNWYRNLAVAQVVVDTLRGFDMAFPEPEEDLSDVTIPG